MPGRTWTIVVFIGTIMIGCAPVRPPAMPTLPAALYAEVECDMLRDATATPKLLVGYVGAYRLSVQRLRQTASACWVIHQRVTYRDRLYVERDVEVCTRDARCTYATQTQGQ